LQGLELCRIQVDIILMAEVECQKCARSNIKSTKHQHRPDRCLQRSFCIDLDISPMNWTYIKSTSSHDIFLTSGWVGGVLHTQTQLIQRAQHLPSGWHGISYAYPSTLEAILRSLKTTSMLKTNKCPSKCGPSLLA
jgi:hypothetical protein